MATTQPDALENTRNMVVLAYLTPEQHVTLAFKAYCTPEEQAALRDEAVRLIEPMLPFSCVVSDEFLWVGENEDLAAYQVDFEDPAVHIVLQNFWTRNQRRLVGEKSWKFNPHSTLKKGSNVDLRGRIIYVKSVVVRDLEKILDPFVIKINGGAAKGRSVSSASASASASATEVK